VLIPSTPLLSPEDRRTRRSSPVGQVSKPASSSSHRNSIFKVLVPA